MARKFKDNNSPLKIAIVVDMWLTGFDVPSLLSLIHISGTWTKLNTGDEVSLSILLRICDYLNCDIGDICEAVRTDKN